MSAPQKPWENADSSLRSTSNMHNFGQSRTVLNSQAPASRQPPGTAPGLPPGTAPGLPQLPPRPPQIVVRRPQLPYNRMSGVYPNIYGSYQGYGGYPYGSYTGSMYPQGSYGYGNYDQPGGLENRFLQVAEESSRDAFQSIESLVRAFTSVSMMLESTYHAMYSSFRAILGVVDNFSRLRQMFAQFITTITILRIIKNFYKKLLYWLGVIDKHPQQERIWEAARQGTEAAVQAKTYSSWPLVTFIGLLIGGPYLVTKFFSTNGFDGKKWNPKTGKNVKTAYPHEAASSAELSFQKDEILNIAPLDLQLPNNGGWLLASNQFGKTGYVPVTLLWKSGRSTSQISNVKTDAETMN